MLSARTLRYLLLVGMGSCLPLSSSVLNAAPREIADARDSDSNRQDQPQSQAQPARPAPAPQPPVQPPPRPAPPPMQRSSPPAWQGSAPRREPDRNLPVPTPRQPEPPHYQAPAQGNPRHPQPDRPHRPSWTDYTPRQQPPAPPPVPHPAPGQRPSWTAHPPRDNDRGDGGHRYYPPQDYQPGQPLPPPTSFPNRDRPRDWDQDHRYRPPTPENHDSWRDWARHHDRDDWRFQPHPRIGAWTYWDPYGFDDPFWGGYSFWNGAYYYTWYEYPSSTYIYQTPSSATYEVDEPPPVQTRPAGPALYFPPTPPPLGTPLPPTLDAGAQSAPSELTLWVGEPFYAPLASRLTEGVLPAGLRAKLDAYRRAKGDALASLQAKIASVAGLAPEPRHSALAAFAREQAPALRAIDESADTIRRILVDGDSGLSADNPWYDRRSWRLGPESAQLDPAVHQRMQFQAVRAAAYYENSLPPSFRRLLREAAMDLQMAALATRSDTGQPQGSPERVVFFSPSTSRVILPPKLPDELASNFDAYDSEKRAIRSELVASVADTDGLDPQSRADANAGFVQRLTPRLIALNALADEIRNEVAATPNAFGPDQRIEIPSDLAEPLRTLLAERRRIRDAIYNEFQTLSALVAPATLRMLPSTTAEAPALSVVLTPHLGESENRIDAMREDLAAFNRTWAPALAAMERRNAELQSAIASRFASFPGAPRGLSPEIAFEVCAAQIREDETWERYDDYRTALFEPGLSPAQRRLLYDASLAALSQPLPGADRTWSVAQ